MSSSLDNEFTKYASWCSNLRKKRDSLLAESCFGVKALTLHYKGQQRHTSTNFAIAGKQLLVTTLLYYTGCPLSPAHISKCNCEVTKVDKIIQFFAK